MRCWKCFAGGTPSVWPCWFVKVDLRPPTGPRIRQPPANSSRKRWNERSRSRSATCSTCPRTMNRGNPARSCSSSRPERRGDNLELLKRHGLPKPIAAGKDFPFIVVSPQCSDGRWEPVKLAVLLDEIVGRYKVDQDHIYVTGLSGGFGTRALAAYEPDRFAALPLICGSVGPVRGKEIAHIPEWVFQLRHETR